MIPPGIILPLLAVVLFFVLWYQKKLTGLFEALLYFIGCTAIGTLAVYLGRQDLSYAAVPFHAIGGGFGVWLYRNYKTSPDRLRRFFGWAGVVCAVLTLAVMVAAIMAPSGGAS